MTRPPDPCVRARDILRKGRCEPVAKYLPRECPQYYIPSRVIDELFTAEPTGLKLSEIYLCDCYRCEEDGGSQDSRRDKGYNKTELTGEYAIIYAVLIYIHRPGLITRLQQKQQMLVGTRYLQQGDLNFLLDEGINDADYAIRDILYEQYKFLVRTFEPRNDITVIPPYELLPIAEDLEAKGQGSFGEVRCFEFQDEKYRGKGFGDVINPHHLSHFLFNN
jgi:hypothetical protein